MNTAFAVVAIDSYQVACPSCGVTSDMAHALSCDCLSKKQTPVCSVCGSCICKLSAAKQRAFWEAAPTSMLTRYLKKPALRLVAAPVASKAPLVMLVEGDEEIRAIGEIVTRLGFRCVTAANGPEALALITADEPALVFTDALMPKMDGQE